MTHTTPIGSARGSGLSAVDRALSRNPDFLSTAVRRGLLDATLDQTARLQTWRHGHGRPCQAPPFDVGYYRSCYWPRYRYCDRSYGYSFVSVYHDPWWWRDREPDVVYVNTYPETTAVVSGAPAQVYGGDAVYPPPPVPSAELGESGLDTYGSEIRPSDEEAADNEDERPIEDTPYEDNYDSLFEEERRTWIETGTAAFASGRYGDASRSYAQAMLADERDGFVKCLYAASKFAVGDYGLAAVALRRAMLTNDMLVTTPPDVRAFYGDAGAFDAQLAALEAVVREHPGQRDTTFLLGYWYYSIGRPERAETLLHDLTVLDERDELCRTLLVAVERARTILKR